MFRDENHSKTTRKHHSKTTKVFKKSVSTFLALLYRQMIAVKGRYIINKFFLMKCFLPCLATVGPPTLSKTSFQSNIDRETVEL